MKQSEKIFICPLDWGLGHTTRCIPIAKKLHKQGHSITFGVNEVQKSLLEQEIYFANYLPFKGYDIEYPKSGNMAIKMLFESPKILKRIKSEHLELQKLIDEHQFDWVISDNRFGLYTDKVHCTYITHQINIQAPNLIKKQLHKIHGKYINKFSECWIPDIENEEKSLGGELSHRNLHKNCSYIGIISRFNEKATTNIENIEYLAIISGPEPQRSAFETQIITELKKTGKKCAILGGKPLENDNKSSKNIEYYNHLKTEEFYQLVCRSKKIICRPGYSSIMDLAILQKPVHFIPTLGQTEQEYLAKFLSKKEGWSRQNSFTLNSELGFYKLPPISTNLKITLD